MNTHKIQLKTEEQVVLYELEKSEMFPDYSAVLKEAIAYGIDLKGLCVKSQNIDDVTWQETDLSDVSFQNCSMENNVFYKCKGELLVHKCNLTSVKIKKSNFNWIDIHDSNTEKINIRNSTILNLLMMNCTMKKSIFWNVKIPSAALFNCNLCHVMFYECVIQFYQISNIKDAENWYQEITFLGGDIGGSNFSNFTDIKQLILWNIDLEFIEFVNDEEFTIIENKNSKVVYAIDSNVIWWMPHHKKKVSSTIPFRHSLKELSNEIAQDFPTTELYPSMEDDVVQEELLAVCEYLKNRIKYLL